MNLDHTTAKQLEKITERKTMNFGVAGSAGPVQYFVLYEDLAKEYAHSDLVVFLLPARFF